MKEILLEILTPIAAAIGLMIAGQIVLLLKWVLRKAKIELTAEQEAALTETSKRAVLSVEEWAAKQAVATAAAKYDKAAEIIKAKFPKVDAASLDTHIHAAVAELGMGAAGAKVEATPMPLPPVEEAKS